MAQQAETGRHWGAAIWPLVTGLAVGFLVGRETGGGHATTAAGDLAPSKTADKSADSVPAGTKLPDKTYKAEGEFPAGWMKSADLATVSGLSFDGLTAPQKTTAMQAMNERNCECGCGMGSIGTCVKKDPNCPRSPNLAKLAIQMAKDGKPLPQILAAIDDKQKPAPGAAAPAAQAAPSGPRKIMFAAHNPRLGPKAAKVTIAEISDFQCPFCKRATPTVKEVEQKYSKDVAVVFVNQPLPFHEHAMEAALAFQAANRQGKAWELHDKMFDNNTQLERANLDKYAAEIGLNMARFKKDMDDPKLKDEIAQDQKLANSVGANGTPTFFINGRELVGAVPFSDFQAIIDEEIKKADALIKKGTPLKDVYQKLMEQAANSPPPAAAAAAPAAPEAKVDVKVGDAPIKGAASAPVTVLEFSDFQCPFCGRVTPTLKQIEDQYPGKVKIAFRNLPLPFHDKAHLAAEASLAANEQGKFWPYHDKLFANQQALDRPSLEKYAEDMGLNMTKFRAALDSGKFKDKVDADAKDAAAVGATGTPTFFVNGSRLVGAQPFDQFKTLIDAELKKK
ncbi:MAG TPA: thioredoxin domain-containing protein [Polyangia bacterium]|jgi:protein-disulfide isomerase|nr:thioredoxin domain-containing protein [Polyangia bacterium]